MYGIHLNIIGFFLLTISGVTGQDQSRNLLVVSKHEPAKSGNTAPKSQQALVVSRRNIGKHSENVINKVKFPSQQVNSFLPKAILADVNVSPTVISPIITTATGFNGITHSFINNVFDKVNNQVAKAGGVFPKGIDKDVGRQAMDLAGLIKASAQKRIQEVLSSAGLIGDQKGNANKENIIKTGNHRSVNFHQQKLNTNPRPSIFREPPDISRSSVPKHLQPTPRTQSATRTIQSASRPFVLSRQKIQASGPLVLAPRRNASPQTVVTRTQPQTVLASSNAISPQSTISRTVTFRRQPRTRARPSIQSHIVTRQRVQSPPNRSPVVLRRRGQSSANQTPTVLRQRPSAVQTPRATSQLTRTSTTRQRGASSQASTGTSRCPSQNDCKLVVPASCRRPSYITDANGRRLCRGCDEDRCAFGGFEQRWGRGFG